MSAEIMLPGREEVTLLSPVSGTKLNILNKDLVDIPGKICVNSSLGFVVNSFYLYFINIGDSVCFLQLADFFVDLGQASCPGGIIPSHHSLLEELDFSLRVSKCQRYAKLFRI